MFRVEESVKISLVEQLNAYEKQLREGKDDHTIILISEILHILEPMAEKNPKFEDLREAALEILYQKRSSSPKRSKQTLVDIFLEVLNTLKYGIYHDEMPEPHVQA